MVLRNVRYDFARSTKEFCSEDGCILFEIIKTTFAIEIDFLSGSILRIQKSYSLFVLRTLTAQLRRERIHFYTRRKELHLFPPPPDKVLSNACRSAFIRVFFYYIENRFVVFERLVHTLPFFFLHVALVARMWTHLRHTILLRMHRKRFSDGHLAHGCARWSEIKFYITVSCAVCEARG